MKITIGHLFPKELTLYGENGNIKALKYALEQENVEVELKVINKENKIDLKNIDFLYIGSGRNKYLKEIKERLLPYKKDFLDYLNKDKILLVTGNAISIFTFLDFYDVREYNEQKVADVVATTSLCPENIYCFENTKYLINSTKSPIFNICTGYGNQETLMEGYNHKNFYATALIGPILARNANLTQYFVDILLENPNS